MLVALEDYFENDIARAAYNSCFPLLSKRFIGKEVACQYLKISQKWLDIFIVQGKIDVYQRRDKDEVLVDAATIVNLRERFSDLVPLRLIAHVLDVDESDVMDLIY